MNGIGASPGFAAGRVFIKKTFIEPEKGYIEDSELECNRLSKAKESLLNKLKRLEQETKERIGLSESQIFGAHQMMLNDPELYNSIEDLVNLKKYEAGYATKVVRDNLVMTFEAMDNSYMKERALDVKDVCNGLISILHGYEDIDYESITEPIVLIARDLSPSDTAKIPKEKVSGFLTEIGGKTSHTAILSRTLEIPAVVGVKGLLSNIVEGDYVLLDGHIGEVIVNPTEAEMISHRNKANSYEKEKEILKSYIGKQSISKDGIKVSLGCNIGHPDDLEYVLQNDGEGIGLFRSEFLYMSRHEPPTEEEQFKAYKKVLSTINGPVVIRTLDIGGDKHIDYLDFPKEENPFLGYRAIRYCLDHKELFMVQLRALLRSSVFGDLKIMFPMISSLQELLIAKEVLREAHDSLVKENVSVGAYEVGMMIEVPSAAVIADILAKEVDFFSIGTNDLIQYTTAVDRMNETLSQLYTPYHPALLRLIKNVIDSGHHEGLWVGMCGEVAGDPYMMPILFAMGLDEFSMSPSSILRSRHLIHQLEKESSLELLEHVLSLKDSDDIEAYLKYNHSSLLNS